MYYIRSAHVLLWLEDTSSGHQGQWGGETYSRGPHLLCSRPLARHATERCDFANTVVRSTRIAWLVILATLGVRTDTRAVLVESLDHAAVRTIREMALAVGASLDSKGHGNQGKGDRCDANHLKA